MIEFVVREGPMFEAMIMNREINNPMYRSVQLSICKVLLFAMMHILILFLQFFFLQGFYLKTRAQHMYTTDGSSTPYYRFDFCLLKVA